MTASVTELPDHEWLARFIRRKEHVRADGTVKADPFIPYKHVELSVTRHLGLSEQQIWAAGELVVSKVKASLQGRADARVLVYTRQRLRSVAAPQDENLNHANVIDWPPDKQSQKEIALELVKEVRYKAKPV